MNTVEQSELDALPHGSVIKTDHGIYLRDKPRLFPDRWCWIKTGSADTYPRIYLKRPAQVLHNPELVEQAYASTDRVAQVILEQVEPGFDWETADQDHRDLYREVARAAIQAMSGAA